MDMNLYEHAALRPDLGNYVHCRKHGTCRERCASDCNTHKPLTAEGLAVRGLPTLRGTVCLDHGPQGEDAAWRRSVEARLTNLEALRSPSAAPESIVTAAELHALRKLADRIDPRTESWLELEGLRRRLSDLCAPAEKEEPR
jgi:hypothetical protein